MVIMIDFSKFALIFWKNIVEHTLSFSKGVTPASFKELRKIDDL